jgi:uncharacterized membrane protein
LYFAIGASGSFLIVTFGLELMVFGSTGVGCGPFTGEVWWVNSSLVLDSGGALGAGGGLIATVLPILEGMFEFPLVENPKKFLG